MAIQGEYMQMLNINDCHVLFQYKGMEKALSLSRHRLSSKNIMLLGGRFIPDDNFLALEPKYKVTKEEIREYILHKQK